MPGKSFESKKIYLSIIQGSLKQSVKEGTPNSERRDYELKDGTKGHKFELTYMEWYGRVRDLRLKDTKYGETLEVEFDDAILTIPVASRYFDDFMMKIPTANLNQTLSVHPYDFEADDGKQKKGISIEQNGQKLKSYYWNDVDQKNCNGLPLPKANAKKTYKKSDWQLYFLTRTNFLKDSLPKIAETIDREISDESFKEPEDPVEPGEDDEEVKIADVPF